jgi:hypothetical protein
MNLHTATWIQFDIFKSNSNSYIQLNIWIEHNIFLFWIQHVATWIQFDILNRIQILTLN